MHKSPPRVFTISAPTSHGRFSLVASSVGLRRVYWPGEKLPQGAEFARLAEAPPKVARLLKTTAKQLADYFSGRRVRFTAKLDLSCLSPFAKNVLRALARMPYGQTITYGQLAKRVGSAGAARAVGNVMAQNPVPIIVPCHRVVASGGSLGGFSAPGGWKVKRDLLNREKRS